MKTAAPGPPWRAGRRHRLAAWRSGRYEPTFLGQSELMTARAFVTWLGLANFTLVYAAAFGSALINAFGTTPRASGKAGLGEIDVPVMFGDVTFRPGDMLFSDEDGVVTLGPDG